MKPWLLVPVKPFDEAKSRLASVLVPTERRALMRRLLVRTLRLAAESQLFAQRLVVSRDPAVLQTARQWEAVTLVEEGAGLNQALAQGCVWAERAGADWILILPADLPLLTAEDLQAICAAAFTGADMVLSCSHDGGTNAMLLRLPPPIALAFGAGSFARHEQLAAAAGRHVARVASPTLAFDVDWPKDLEMLGDGMRGNASLTPSPLRCDVSEDGAEFLG